MGVHGHIHEAYNVFYKFFGVRRHHGYLQLHKPSATSSNFIKPLQWSMQYPGSPHQIAAICSFWKWPSTVSFSHWKVWCSIVMVVYQRVQLISINYPYVTYVHTDQQIMWHMQSILWLNQIARSTYFAYCKSGNHTYSTIIVTTIILRMRDCSHHTKSNDITI